jgi:molybdopterin-guanine dinucleotide biosynthesis protein A
MTDRRVSAIVLAGGRSSRFGRDKLSEPLDGRSLLEHSIAAVRAVSNEVLVITAPLGAPTVDDDVRVVHDSAPFGGPLLGLAAGLAAAREGIVLVTAGDMPEVSPAVIGLLIDALDDASVEVAVLAEGDRPRPLPMVARRDLAREAIERLIDTGERRLGALTEQLARTVIAEATWRAVDPEGRTLRDIDTPADLP